MEKGFLFKEVLSILNDVLGKNKKIPLHEPSLTNLDKNFVLKCIESNYVSSIGKYVEEFEEKIKFITGSKYAIAIVNGTSAIELSLRVVNVERNDEVFLPALTFVATANAISHIGAIPHFIDSNIDNLGVDPDKLENYIQENCDYKDNNLINKLTRRKIKAIIPVHVFGMPCKIDQINKISKKYNLHLIEDSAEALGSLYKNKSVGNYGKLGVLSFNGNKIITTGGGGAIITDNKKLAKKIKHLSTTAKVSHEWDFYHDEIGWNLRLPNLNAALGCSQLEQFPNLLQKKRELASRYKEAFKSSKNFSFIVDDKDSKSNYWLNTIRLNKPNKMVLNFLLNNLNKNGFNCRPSWRLINTLPMYRKSPKSDLQNSILLQKSLLNLPSSPSLIK